MTICYRGVLSENELWLAILLMTKMTGRSTRETRDPVATPNARLSVHVNEIEILADGERSNLCSSLHHETFRANPSEADPSGGMNPVTKTMLQKQSPQRPGKSERKQHEQGTHFLTPSSS
jgi:hypothetical protein